MKALVILELKKVNGPLAPTEATKRDSHSQLRGYVERRTQMEQKMNKHVVAGFLVVMYDDRRKYGSMP
jgi:hypothetical protein